MTPGMAAAASVSIDRMRAWARSLRRKATCSAWGTRRSSVKLPCPASRRGSSTRFMRAPTFRGRRPRSSASSAAAEPSIISVGSLLERRPLPLVMAAQHSRAASLDALDLGERGLSLINVPGVSGDDLALEHHPHAHRIGGEEERAGAIQVDQGSGRARRVPGHRNEHDALVAEHVVLTVDLLEWHRLVPIDWQVAHGYGVRGSRHGQLRGVADHGRLAEKGIAAAMVGMEVGANHYVDVLGFNADGAQVVEDVIAGRRYGHHDLGQPAPARLCIL